MQSVQRNLVENETPQEQKLENAGPVPSAPAKQALDKKEPSDRPPADAMYVAFAWLFGSGCF